MNKNERSMVASYIAKHTELTHHQIANTLKLGYSTITRIAMEFAVKREVGKRVQLNYELLNLGVKAEQE
jgi:hypothetical protein